MTGQVFIPPSSPKVMQPSIISSNGYLVQISPANHLQTPVQAGHHNGMHDVDNAQVAR